MYILDARAHTVRVGKDGKRKNQNLRLICNEIWDVKVGKRREEIWDDNLVSLLAVFWAVEG